MEHKLITGGSEYLPFARSRIKALKATGLKYASQKFEIDGVSIRVRIAGDHEYIELEGGDVGIYSGVVKTGEIVTLPVPSGSPPGTAPVKVLRSFRPTQNCWEIPLKEAPEVPVGAFSDARQLAYAPDAAKQPGAVATQIRDIKPSMFSGEMAAAVQILLGRKVPVLYKMSFDVSHGVVRGADGTPWLIEISKVRGVLAMPLPVTKVKAKNEYTAVKESAALFGGVPSGKTFPADEALASAIAAGKLLRLMSPAEIVQITSKTPHSPVMGFTFGVKDAYNTCWASEAGENTSYLYRLSFSFEPKKDMNGSCVLTLVEQGPLSAIAGDNCMLFYKSPSLYVSPPTGTVTSYQDGRAPILARHVNGSLDVVYAETQASSSTETTSGTPQNTWQIATTDSYHLDSVSDQRSSLRFISSALIGTSAGRRYAKSRFEDNFLGVSVLFSTGVGREAYGRGRSTLSEGSSSPTFRKGVWNPGERDGLLVIEGPSSSSYNSRSSEFAPQFISAGNPVWAERAVSPSIGLRAAAEGKYETYITDTPSPAAMFSNPLSAGILFDTLTQGNDYLSSQDRSDGRWDGLVYLFFEAAYTNNSRPNTGMPNGACTYLHSSGEKTGYTYESGGNSAGTFFSLATNSPFITACSMFGPSECSYVVDLATGAFPEGVGTFHLASGSLISGAANPTDEEFNFIGYLD